MTDIPAAPRRRIALLPWLLAGPATVMVILFLVAPVAETIGTTFTAAAGIFANYTRFFASPFNQVVLWRTLEMSALTTLASLGLGFATAMVLARAPRRLKGILIIAAVFPLLTGVVVRSFAWIVILGRNGAVNWLFAKLGITSEPIPLLYTQFSVVVGLVYLFTPIMILSLVGVLENIEKEIPEAAASLGASPLRVFRQVVLPLALPGLIIGSVLVFTGSFTAYATPKLLGSDRQVVLATLMYNRAMVSFDWPTASTIATIMVVITFAVVIGMTRVARRFNPAAH